MICSHWIEVILRNVWQHRGISKDKGCHADLSLDFMDRNNVWFSSCRKIKIFGRNVWLWVMCRTSYEDSLAWGERLDWWFLSFWGFWLEIWGSNIVLPNMVCTNWFSQRYGYQTCPKSVGYFTGMKLRTPLIFICPILCASRLPWLSCIHVSYTSRLNGHKGVMSAIVHDIWLVTNTGMVL